MSFKIRNPFYSLLFNTVLKNSARETREKKDIKEIKIGNEIGFYNLKPFVFYQEIF